MKLRTAIHDKRGSNQALLTVCCVSFPVLVKKDGRLLVSFPFQRVRNREIIFKFYSKLKHSCHRMNPKKGWTEQEDKLLLQIASVQGNRRWIKISDILHQTARGCKKSARQCRQRFINYLNLQQGREFVDRWSQQQLSTLFKLYQKYGAKWTLIASLIRTKSENAVKNRFYCAIRKFLRQLNAFLKAGIRKNKKEIKYQSIMRVVDKCGKLPEDLKEWNQAVRNRIIHSAFLSTKEATKFEPCFMEDMIQSINQFNLQTRNFKPTKLKNPDNKVYAHFETQMEPVLQVKQETPRDGQLEQQQNQITSQCEKIPEAVKQEPASGPAPSPFSVITRDEMQATIAENVGSVKLQPESMCKNDPINDFLCEEASPLDYSFFM